VKNITSVERILIVDDVPKNIQILGKLLSRENREVAYALSGKETLTLLKNNNFDLILLDIMMPEMDGFEVCKVLMNDEKTADIPIIFLTAKTETEHIVQGFQLGARDYITKPFNAAELTARIDTHLELVRSKKQLVAYSHNLEEKVAERTMELEVANKQLSNLEKAKSDFLGIISHELRSPLNGIIGITSLLQQSIKDVEQHDYLGYLSEASKRLLRFSEMALLITSLQSNNQKVELFEISIKMLFEMVIDELSDLIQEKNIEVVINTDDYNLLVRADADLLRKSLCILVEKFILEMPSGGKIELGISKLDHGIAIDVRDNGEGFSEHVLSHFSNFMQQETFVVEEDVGLPIAALKLIMNAHNGTVKLLNNTHGGACVSLCFND
jgi:two-component system sensor histidine kinase/response regulator